MIALLRDDRGFTLVELILAAVILAFAMAAIFTLQWGGQQAYLLGANRIDTQQNARVALDLMTRELRSAQSVTSTVTNCTDCDCATHSPDITFVDQTGQTIEYACSANTLNRTVNGTATALIGGVQALTITAYSTYDVPSGTYTTTTCGTSAGGSCTAGPYASVIVIRILTKNEEGNASGLPGDQHAKMESAIRLRTTLL
jgi:prepilin-type N-terminal cleavage/methylation domain-containing protein